jgi:hypothetical protein
MFFLASAEASSSLLRLDGRLLLLLVGVDEVEKECERVGKRDEPEEEEEGVMRVGLGGGVW